MYTHPGDDRPSPGTFSDLLAVIRYYRLTPGELVAVIVETPRESPFDGPHAVLFDGVVDENRLGDMVFRTMAFVDRDSLIETLHAAGIHVHIDPDFRFVVATAGPAAGEPDAPKVPTPMAPPPESYVPSDPDEPELPIDDPAGEVLVAGPPNT